jgi:Holliday junction resolvase-like predicted endonuclease
MIVNKSSRHSKITGDFAESIVLYWLSKYGFECAKVDHTGIDLIAKNPKTQELMGISVKSRSRNTGKEGQYIGIQNHNFEKVDFACQVFFDIMSRKWTQRIGRCVCSLPLSACCPLCQCKGLVPYTDREVRSLHCVTCF